MEFDQKEPHNYSTAVVLFDGYSAHIPDHLSTIHTFIGDGVQFLGGGTGYLDRRDDKSLFCNQGKFRDATFICLSAQKVQLGVKHGWKKKAGPFLVTNSKKNTLMELNWENPIEVYQKTLNDLGYSLDNKADFFQEAHRFPFGIYKKGSEYIVRDPVKVTSDGFIECFGDIPSNTIIDLLEGNEQTLTEAAEDAAKQCLNHDISGTQVLLFDCISRSLFLGKNIQKELNGIMTQLKENQPNLSLEGALSFGEVSSMGSGYLEILNKTVVLGLFYK
ncbi:MAG: FIST signal transduction protein [Marinifilaceae bacterium]